jgi:hypothetical protein
MNRFRGGLIALCLVILTAAMALPFALQAATSNPSPASPGYYVVSLHFDTQLTATQADKASFKIPWPSQLVAMKCTGRALGGTGSPTYTWTLQEAAGTLATCAPTAAGTEVEGTISDAAVADEAVVTLDYAATGTSPTQDDATVILIFKRL